MAVKVLVESPTEVPEAEAVSELSQIKMRVVLLSPEDRIVARPPTSVVVITGPISGKYNRVRTLVGLARGRVVKDGRSGRVVDIFAVLQWSVEH